MEMSQAEYLETCETAARCPSCRSFDIAQALPGADGERVALRFVQRCWNCASTWEEVHTLARYDRLVKGDGT